MEKGKALGPFFCLPPNFRVAFVAQRVGMTSECTFLPSGLFLAAASVAQYAPRRETEIKQVQPPTERASAFFQSKTMRLQ